MHGIISLPHVMLVDKSGFNMTWVNFLSASATTRHLLITFSNSLVLQMFDTQVVFLKEFFEKISFKKSADNKNVCKITQPAELTHISLASFFVGHKQTVETKTRRRITRCLIRVSTVCLQDFISKFE